MSMDFVSRLLKVSDKVYLNTEDFGGQTPSKKLDHKTYGPYRITKLVGNYACKLKFPVHSNAHLVFQVNKLRLIFNDYFLAKVAYFHSFNNKRRNRGMKMKGHWNTKFEKIKWNYILKYLVKRRKYASWKLSWKFHLLRKIIGKFSHIAFG